jgi:GNAT superfamily N-acetyltransferase
VSDDVNYFNKDLAKKLIEGDPNGLGAQLAEKFGDFVLEKTGSPIAAAGAKTLADLAPMFIGGLSGHGPGVSAITEESAALPYKIKAFDDTIALQHPHVKSSGEFMYPETLDERLGMSPEEHGLAYERPFYLESLEVHPKQQGTGLGSRALDVMEQKAKAAGADGMVLNASPQGTSFENNHSVRDESKLGDLVDFYKKNGYEEIKNEGSNVLMHKPLKAQAGVGAPIQNDEQHYAGGGMVEPAGLDQFLSQPTQGSVPHGTSLPSAPAEPAGLDQFLEQPMLEQKYGTLTERAKADVEALARGATLGLSDVAETKLGISTPEEMSNRKRGNPTETNIMQMLGGAGTIVATGGVAAPIEEALGGGKLATAAGYGLEGAGFGMGNVISDHALGDPNLNAQRISTEVGMSALLGIGAGLGGRGLKSLLGKYGYIKNSVPDVVSEGASEANLEAETANVLKEKARLKDNTPEIVAAARELDAPLSEGMISADPWVQKAEDALVNGAPTYAGIKRAKIYEQGYEAAKGNLTRIVGEPEAEGGMSKAQLGKALEQSLASNIAEENEPVSHLYNEIRQSTQDIPISQRSLPRITGNIMDLDAVRLDPDGPAGQLAKRMAKNIENIKTVDEVKSLRKILNDSLAKTASDSERYVMGEISDRLKDLEKNTIQRYGQDIVESHEKALSKMSPEQQIEANGLWGERIKTISNLTSKIDEADKLYRPFIEKIKTLAKMLGKKSVSGAQGAINFVTTDLSPEQLAQRAFQKGNSEMAEFFAKSFPNEWELVKQYQKGVLRDASIIERTGQFNSRAFIKKVDQLEPEIQKLLFSPDELKKINAAKTYLRSIPESFNPSGTSHMSAFREFFAHPTSAAIANVRDFGIDAYIKAMGKLPPHLRPDPTTVGISLADKFNKFNSTRNIMDGVSEKISKGAKSIFTSGAARGLVLSGASLGVHSYEDRVRRIQELASNSDVLGNHLSNSVEGIHGLMPNISQSMQNHMAASVLFLQSKIPGPKSQFMLSPTWKPSEQQKQKFNRYYGAVADPVDVLNQIKSGKLTGEAVEAVQATHPELFQEMRTKVLSEMDQEKARALPYNVKLCLAKFLGEPLDASMLPSVIISNQLALNQPSSPNGMSPKQQRSTQAGLAKLKVAQRATTDTQDLEGEKA